MKNLSRTFLFGLATLVFFGCSSKNTVTVGADERLDANISEFRTYNWVSDAGEMPTTHIFFGSQGTYVFHKEPARSDLKKAIDTQLEAKGFTKTSDNADMLVNYSVLEEGGQLRTYTRENHSYLGEGPVERDAEMVQVEPGTILVNFLDADTGMQVWQGFASGALEESDAKDNNTLQAKVAAIFDQFDFSAFNITTRQAATR
nr:DUF4136 domain-containing protein [Cytophagales bacterium]